MKTGAQKIVNLLVSGQNILKKIEIKIQWSKILEKYPRMKYKR